MVLKKDKPISLNRAVMVKARRTPKYKVAYPKEENEQMDLATYLDMRGFLWNHSPNEGMFRPQYYKKRKKLGVKNGFPDVMIFRMVRREGDCCYYCGMAIELKRQKGGVVEPEQVAWLDDLEGEGWITSVAYGAKDAIDKIEAVYGKPEYFGK